MGFNSGFKGLISASEWPWQRDPFTVGANFHGETARHKTYTCQHVGENSEVHFVGYLSVIYWQCWLT